MDWENEIKTSIRTPNDLSEHIAMSADEQSLMAEILEKYPLSVTPYYLSLIDFSDPNDPIRKMAIPSLAETDLSGSLDTSGEAGNTVMAGLQHKYKETALMLSTGQCAMYCRHCFRKRLVGLPEEEVARQFAAIRGYIQAHQEISNVLISGGDALMNSNERIDSILSMLNDISHLDVIRICTRMPVVLPARIIEDSELQTLMERHNRIKQIFMVTQFNHPREVTEKAVSAVKCVLQLGIPVLNQTVLLRGVNDDPNIMGALLKGMTRIGVKPYYVFQCRPVTGVSKQFQVPLIEGYKIVKQARAMQNGLGKAFCYCMSTVAGKMEIIGELRPGEMLFRYHEAADESRLGSFIVRQIEKNQTWLDMK